MGRARPVTAGRRLAGSLCLAVALGLNAGAAGAQDAGDGSREGARALAPVTVVATRNPIEAFSFPGMVTVLGRPELRAVQPSTPDDILRFVPGVEFTGGPRRTGEGPSIRGFSGPDVILTIDGARQNFGSTHDGRFFIDPSLLKRVEVLRGPASSLYGSGGTGGVIAFQTLDAADLLAPGQSAGSLLSTGYQSVNRERVANLTAYAAPGGGTDVLASLTKRDSGTIRLGDGNELRDTDDDIVAGLAKGSWRLADHHRVEGSLVAFRNQAREPNNGQQGISVGETAAGLVDKDIRTQTLSVAYRYDNPDDRLLDLDLVAYRTAFQADELRLDDAGSGPVGELLRRDVDTTGMRIDNRSRLPLPEGTSVTLTYGGEYWEDSQDGGDGGMRDGQPDPDADERLGVPDADARFTGVFAQAEVTLSDPLGTGWGDLLVIPGARYGTYTTSSSNRLGADNAQQEFSPKIGVSWLPSDRWMLFANYAQAFRAPTMNEIYLTGLHFPLIGPGRGVVGFNRFEANPDLEPQTTRTVEAGAGLMLDDVLTAHDSLQVKATRFRVDGENFIDLDIRQAPPIDCIPFQSDRVRVPAGAPGEFRSGCEGATFARNIPRARLSGTEVDATYDSPRFRVAFGYSSIDGENADTGAKLGVLTPDQFTLNTAVRLPELDSLVGWRVLLARDFDKVDSRFDAREGYSVHDLYVSWRPSAAPINGVEVDLGVDNVFDEAYTRVSNFAVEPGRSFKVLVGYSLAW